MDARMTVCKNEAYYFVDPKLPEKAKELSYERQHKNAYMYWYNKVKKLEKEAPGTEKLKTVQAAFAQFRQENAKRKTAVKEGRLAEKEYIDWLYRQQGGIDRLML